jgi:glycerophosphoryl diester phosphodiesterase
MALMTVVLMVLVFKSPRGHFFRSLVCSIVLILAVIAEIFVIRAFVMGYASRSVALLLSIFVGLLILILICVTLLSRWKKAPEKEGHKVKELHGHSWTMLFVLMGLTLVYLTFELAFNARLLDVVGGEATLDEIHHIEHYGRILSGTAAALFLLQFLLKHDENIRMECAEKGATSRKEFGWPRILTACLLCVFCVYHGLQAFVDYLVTSRDGDFRRQAVNVSLIQNALLNDRVDLVGIDADNGLYRLPEGKAFLALFPFMATSVEDLEQRMEEAKIQILRRTISERIDPKTYFDNYQKAVQTVTTQWQKYRGNIEDTEQVDKEFEKAWKEYEDTLCGRRNCGLQECQCTWTPDDVPISAWSSVRRQVQRKVHVPNDWRPNDQQTFRAAIARQMMEKVAKEGVTIDGQKFPPGLSQAEFFQQPVIRRKLNTELHLPNDVRVPLSVNDTSAFLRDLYQPMLQREIRIELEKYTADAASFETGGANAEMGIKATQATLIPPIALFFSLMGAIGHLGKLSYLLAEFCLLAIFPRVSRPWAKRVRAIALHSLLLIPVGLFLFCWITLSQMENRVTRSALYLALQKQLQNETLSHIVHVVSVGQGFAYPFDEAIRQNVLLGLNFGYQSEDKPSLQAETPKPEISKVPEEKPVTAETRVVDEASAALATQCRKMKFFAHRGSADYPENSRSALRAAVQGPWDGVETDVQALSDGELALHHDSTLERTTNLRARSVSRVDSLGWKKGKMRDRQGEITEEAPALLEEVLPDIAASGKPINVEIKEEKFQNCALATRTARMLMDALPPKARQISASDPRHLSCARKEDSQAYFGHVVIDHRNVAERSRNLLGNKNQAPALNKDALQYLKWQVGAPLGIHVDAYTFAKDSSFYKDAAQEGISVMTYALTSDLTHARQLREAWNTQGRLPDGVIIDGTPEAFCAAMVLAKPDAAKSQRFYWE